MTQAYSTPAKSGNIGVQALDCRLSLISLSVMTPLQAQQLLDNAECVASADTVQAVIDRMADEIAGTLAAELPLVLAVMGGAVVFAGQLLPRL
jgi:hypothetical protein